MATLTGNTIASTYAGLLSVTGTISTAGVEVVEDGAGTDTALWLADDRAEVKLGTSAADDFIVKSDSTAVLVVEGDNKKVGIGTSAPTVDLEVASLSSASPQFRLSKGNVGDKVAISSQAIGEIQFIGYDDTFTSGTTGQQGAGISAQATAAWGSDENDAASSLSFWTQSVGGDNGMGAQRMIIAQNGYVGIGTGDPSALLHIVGDPGDDGDLALFQNSRDDVDDDDNILVLSFSGDADVTSGTGEGHFIKFRDSDTSEMGVIRGNNSTVVVDAYSDYRLKNSITTLDGGLNRVNQLRPVNFIYNTDSNDKIHEGFIAHEVQEHIPYAVRGEKDAVKDDGSIKSQSFCVYNLIPQLVSAIQELSAKVEALENA